MGLDGDGTAPGSGTGGSGTTTTTTNSSNPPPVPEQVSEDGGPFQSCFPAGTLVSTENGLQPIQSVRVGDQVWAFDHVSEKWKLRNVLKCYESLHQGDIVAISIAGETIEATPGHPFWVIEGEELLQRPMPEHCPKAPANSKVPGRWVDAGDLQIGDMVLLQKGKSAAIVEMKLRAADQKVYNIMWNCIITCWG